MAPKIGEIYKDDVEELYHVIDVFTRSCVVEPLVNEDCLASEIMSFKAMQQEGWVRIGYTEIYNQEGPAESITMVPELSLTPEPVEKEQEPVEYRPLKGKKSW